MISIAWIEEAADRLAPHIVRTPLTHDAARNVYLKWENRQRTGSFKVRGALNKVLTLAEEERRRGIVTASAGNHGQGVALAGQLTGAPVTCFVSEQAVPVKVQAMRALGATVIAVPGGYAQAEAAGRRFAAEHGAIWISPYNDPWVIAGQGTIGLEIAQALMGKDVEACLVPVSGGGLIAGIGLALRNLLPQVRLIGVQAEVAPFLHALFYRGSQEGIPDRPSLADGLTGAVEADSITIPLVKDLVDEIMLVSEAEIAQAVAFALRVYGETVEPSGAVALAAALRQAGRKRPGVVIVSGGNIQPEVQARIVSRDQREAQR